MASKLEVNKTTYRKYELGMSAPGAAVLAGACRHGVNVNWLLTGLEPMMWSHDEPPDWAKDDVLEELCRTLEKLRLLDSSKYEMLALGFIARSAEAGEHAQLKRSITPPTAVDLRAQPLPSDLQDILSAPMGLTTSDGKPFQDVPAQRSSDEIND